MTDDIRDILNVERDSGIQVSKDKILDVKYAKKTTLPSVDRPRPRGMVREVFALTNNNKTDLPPIIQTNLVPMYNCQKANFGMQRVRQWEWATFVNPAREDGVSFFHWQRVSDRDKEYQFARFNKKIDILKYTDSEYEKHLVSETWTREETDRLFDMCERFDLRFIVIQGRWTSEKYENAIKRSTEDLKDRYYSVCYILTKIRGGNVDKQTMYDAGHEVRRKQQLERLYNRTPEEIKGEKVLLYDLHKIEIRKHEVSHKTQDLEKLMSSVNRQNDDRKILKKDKNHKRNHIPVPIRSTKVDPNNFEVTNIKFPDIKNSGVFTRTPRMKIPANVNPKKATNVKLALKTLKIQSKLIPTEGVCQNYNNLRNEIVLLSELKAVCKSSAFELQTLKHQYKTIYPGGVLKIDPELLKELPSLSVNEDEEDEEELNFKII